MKKFEFKIVVLLLICFALCVFVSCEVGNIDSMISTYNEILETREDDGSLTKNFKNYSSPWLLSEDPINVLEGALKEVRVPDGYVEYKWKIGIAKRDEKGNVVTNDAYEVQFEEVLYKNTTTINVIYLSTLGQNIPVNSSYTIWLQVRNVRKQLFNDYATVRVLPKP